MKRFKFAGLVAVLLSIFGLSGEAFAQVDDCCFNSPLQSLSYSLDFRPLYLLPSSSNLDYAVEAEPFSDSTPKWVIHDINPDYHFGFGLELGILFSAWNSELSVNWDHFQSTDHTSKRVGSSHTIGPVFEIGPHAYSYSRAKGKVKFQFDSAHLDYGIFVNVCDCLQATLYAGINAARVNQKLTSKFSDSYHTVARSVSTPSKFSGVGPELGIDFAYSICDCLEFTGGASAALLVGRQKNHTAYKSSGRALSALDTTLPNVHKTKCHSHTQLVSAFEGKLGLSYAFTFCGYFFANVEAGYEAKVYINAVQSVDIGSKVITLPSGSDTVGVYARSFRKTLSNFSLSGPYLSFDVVY